MFLQKQSYFSRLAKSYPILKLVDVYDRQSFIRVYVLDNVYVCVLVHILFYVALWYATTVIRKMEKANKEMLKIVEENRTRLEDVVALKDKKTEYDEAVVKVKEAQRLTSQELEDEMQRLSTELINAEDKLLELEKVVKKYISSGESCKSSAGDVADRENERAGPCFGEGRTVSLENLKILEPSFPPPQPPEPPPRKYGIFVSRPPGQRRPPPAATAATTPPKSDTSNYASVEASEESTIYHQPDKFMWSAGDSRRDDRRRKRSRKFASSGISTRFNVKKLHDESLKNVTPFTRSLLGLVTIFTQKKP